MLDMGSCIMDLFVLFTQTGTYYTINTIYKQTINLKWLKNITGTHMLILLHETVLWMLKLEDKKIFTILCSKYVYLDLCMVD